MTNGRPQPGRREAMPHAQASAPYRAGRVSAGKSSIRRARCCGRGTCRRAYIPAFILAGSAGTLCALHQREALLAESLGPCQCAAAPSTRINSAPRGSSCAGQWARADSQQCRSHCRTRDDTLIVASPPAQWCG